jgi:hypothetical protein
VLTTGRGTLVTTTAGVTVTGSEVDFPNIAPGQTADATTPFTFTLAGNVACGSVINFVIDVSSQGSISRIPFTVRVGNAQTADFFSDAVESGESQWTHASGIKKKKNRVDTWVISGKRVHSGSSAWFTSDPGTKVIDAPRRFRSRLPADSRSLQLVFFHTF